MTLVAGIQCTDGIVLAADSRAIPGTGVVDVTEDVKKVHWIGQRFLVALGGFSGQGRRFLEALCSLQIEEATQSCFAIQEVIHAAMQPLVASVAIAAKNAREIDGKGGLGHVLAEALIAYLGSEGPCLVHLNPYGQCDRIDDTIYHVIGDGEKVAAPFLSYIKRHVWGHNRPTIATGIVSVLWMFHFAHNCAGDFAPPWTVATLQRSEDGEISVEFLSDDVLDAHHRYVNFLEEAFGQLPQMFDQGGKDVPPKPSDAADDDPSKDVSDAKASTSG